MFSKRSNEAEIMDDLYLGGDEMDQTLTELENINKWLGGNHVTINGLEKMCPAYSDSRKISIADLGCGSGEMLKLISKWGKKKNLTLELTGFDANDYVVSHANRNCKEFGNIQVSKANVLSKEFSQKQFDIITCTLFLHHFTDEQLIGLLSQFKNQAKVGIIINDIHRHWFA